MPEWNTDTLTIAEAEALFAEPLPPAGGRYDERPYPDSFAEPELIEVYRRVTAELVAALEEVWVMARRNGIPGIWDVASAAIAKAKP